jgi:hypothetical protein
LNEIPISSRVPSDEQISTSLEKTLKKEPKLKYEIDLTGGKLNLSYEFKIGRISGELDAFAILKYSSAVAAGYRSNIYRKELKRFLQVNLSSRSWHGKRFSYA